MVFRSNPQARPDRRPMALHRKTVVWHLTVRRMRRDQDYARLFQLHPVELESQEGDKTT